MRTSRLSKDTSALLGGAASQTMTSPPRRTTRSALARFTFHETAASPASSLPTSNSLPDIEDGTASGPRKRRRVAREEHITTTMTTTTTTTTTAVTEIPAQHAKLEELTPTAPKQKQRKPARIVKGSTPSSVATVEPPTDWEHMYNLVRKMRFGGPARDAPVDTMGCERLYAPGASDRDKRFHILVALMLSSQTKDTVNAVAMGRLHKELPPHEPRAPAGLNLENVLAVEPVKLNELIRQVGFHNNKTKFIKQAAVILRDHHASDIPATIDGLTSLPGVGPKMAHLCLSAAWDRTEGIGVDVHVHRITNLWGWHGKKPTSGPEATRLALEAWLPREKWHEINTLLVGLGQTVCPPQAGSRRCGECSLGLEGLCKAADRKKVAEGRRKEHVKVEKEEEDSLQTVIKLEEECEEDEVEVKQEETVTSLTGQQVTLQEAAATTKDEADAGTDNQPRRAHAAEARRRSGRQCGTST